MTAAQLNWASTKHPWRIFLSHRLTGLPRCLSCKESACQCRSCRRQGSVPGSERCPRGEVATHSHVPPHYRGAWRAITEQLSTQSHGLKAKWGSSASDFNFTLSTISLNSCGLHPHLSESFQPGSIHCLQLHQPGFTGSHNTSTHVKYLGI